MSVWTWFVLGFVSGWLLMSAPREVIVWRVPLFGELA